MTFQEFDGQLPEYISKPRRVKHPRLGMFRDMLKECELAKIITTRELVELVIKIEYLRLSFIEV
jgi:hypothetical protein